MLGRYDNFPVNVHFTIAFKTALSRGKLQGKIISTLLDMNRRNFSFEDVGVPAVPRCAVIFEFGIADQEAFCYLDEAEAATLRPVLEDKPLQILDLFCGIRYYKNGKGKRAPLKFDYYMIRLGFGEREAIEMQIFHERGPRYISPDDLALFLEHRVNLEAGRKILKRGQVG